MACDVDSTASSHSCCHSPVPKEEVSCLSCGSDGDPVAVATSDCDDRMEESRQRSGGINCGNHGNVDQWTLVTVTTIHHLMAVPPMSIMVMNPPTAACTSVTCSVKVLKIALSSTEVCININTQSLTNRSANHATDRPPI